MNNENRTDLTAPSKTKTVNQTWCKNKLIYSIIWLQTCQRYQITGIFILLLLFVVMLFGLKQRIEIHGPFRSHADVMKHILKSIGKFQWCTCSFSFNIAIQCKIFTRIGEGKNSNRYVYAIKISVYYAHTVMWLNK